MKHKITRFAKITIIAIISIIILAGSGAALLFYFYPAESVLKIIKNQSETALGRKVEIQGLKYSRRVAQLTSISGMTRRIILGQSMTGKVPPLAMKTSLSMLNIFPAQMRTEK